MSQVQPIFITVTTTVTGIPRGTLNATQIHQYQEASRTGSIIALSVLSMFVLLALILLICWGVLRARRPPPPPMIDNPDAVRQGRGAFLPIIGRKDRKSTAGSLGMGDSGDSSRVSIQSLYKPPQARRISMWATEDSYPSAIPSPPLEAVHTRSSSTASANHSTIHRQRSRSSSPRSAHSAKSSRSFSQGYISRYYDGGSLDFVPMESPPPPMIPPKIEQVHRSPIVEDTRFSIGDDMAVSPVSPDEPVVLGIARYHYGGGVRTHDRIMYA